MTNLNSQQLAIIDEVKNSDDSIIVLARAGCGKTFTLIEVIETIVSESLGSVAIMAFNKSASNEFEARIAAKGINTAKVFAGTVHSFGFRAWRTMAPRAKVDGYKVSNFFSRDYEFRTQATKLVSLAKQTGIGITCDLHNREEWNKLVAHFDVDTNGNTEEVIDAAIAALEWSIDAAGEIIDFDDMIFMPLFANCTLFKNDFVLIDEAQDTNVTRRLLALAMLKENGRLIAVGDDRQAIYGFTGADADSLDQIRIAKNARVLPLSITYRCPSAVVAEANKLVPDLEAHASAPIGKVRHISAMVET